MNKNHCYIVAVDADTNKIRPSRVRRSDARKLGCDIHLNYDDCMKAVIEKAKQLNKEYSS